jgi:hypothetical protein
MNAPLSASELSNVFSQPAPDRYTFFLTEATLQDKVWTLKGVGGFVTFSDDEGRDCFPFWPAPEFAEALANDDWSDCEAEPLALAVFMDRWLTGMARDGRLVAVFPAPDGSCIAMDPLALLQDLEEERNQTG